MSSGVYFSANDKVYNWALGFLRSFRRYNPELLLYWIPFDDQVQKINSLQEEFNFQTYNDQSFKELEELGQAYELGHSPYGKYWFRRYAAFWGPLDYFIYLDGRFLVLDNLKPVLNLLTQHTLDFLYYDQAPDQVYKSNGLREGFLVKKGARSFLSGVWGGKSNTFSAQDMISLGYESLKYRDQLNPRNTDQAFINYCIDSRPELRIGKISEWLGNTVHQSWARQSGKVYHQGEHYYLWDYGGLDHRKKVLLLHWAGYHWNDALPQSHILNKFSSLSMTTRILRFLNRIKRSFKSNFFFRKILGHI